MLPSCCITQFFCLVLFASSSSELLRRFKSTTYPRHRNSYSRAPAQSKPPPQLKSALHVPPNNCDNEKLYKGLQKTKKATGTANPLCAVSFSYFGHMQPTQRSCSAGSPCTPRSKAMQTSSHEQIGASRLYHTSGAKMQGKLLGGTLTWVNESNRRVWGYTDLWGGATAMLLWETNQKLRRWGLQ
jgi:hypothetical protein